MASADDQVYRRVGRGGAGNWYSKKDVEEAEKAQQQADIEAQKQNIASAAGPANPIAASTQYHRAGRGGAGNFHEPATTAPDAVDPVAVQQTEEQIEKIKAAVAAQKPRTGGMGGRGGVGNWSSNSNSLNVQQQEKEEQKKVQEVELRVLKDVEAGLAMPKPAYQRASTDREDGVAN
ncbi:hypothetical protein QBC37DRAFT_413641 [Rhypophila decipiens]|uniref:Uncharacterized protein n=1 Tax=Rhypophila decipiens TaxID=261697 RepID=A0AAN6YGD2_9PEZI|nr:hypothetical protein QBC37DRAFT_413641 [Rhypophila decipiens]